jgi:hypothetical protein
MALPWFILCKLLQFATLNSRVCNVCIMYYVMQWSLVVCHCAMCIGVWWFIGLCVHFVVYFDSIVIIDGWITIVDFGVDYNHNEWTNSLTF